MLYMKSQQAEPLNLPLDITHIMQTHTKQACDGLLVKEHSGSIHKVELPRSLKTLYMKIQGAKVLITLLRRNITPITQEVVRCPPVSLAL
jgi:hypothetical protein